MDEDWEVWTRWYEARLRGVPTYPQLSAEVNEAFEIARVLDITDEDWEAGPKVVNARIKEIVEWDAKDNEETSEEIKPEDQSDSNDDAEDSRGFEQKPAAHRFENIDGRIEASWQSGDPFDREVASDIHRGLQQKATALLKRLQKTNAPTRPRETIEHLLKTLGDDVDDVRPGDLLMRLRSVQADVTSYDTAEARKELFPDAISQIQDVWLSLDDFVSLYPSITKMNAAALALKIQGRDINRVREFLADIRNQSLNSDAVGSSTKGALEYAETEIEQAGETAATTLDDDVRARAIEREAELVALQAIDYRNYVSAALKPFSNAGKWAMGEASDIGRDSWKEIKKGIPRGAGKIAEAIPKLALSGLVTALAGPVAGLAALLGTFDPLAKKAQEVQEASKTKPEEDDEEDTPSDVEI